jgi:hypothetical protein
LHPLKNQPTVERAIIKQIISAMLDQKTEIKPFQQKLKPIAIGIAPHNAWLCIGVAPHGLISIGAVPHGLVSIGLVPMGIVSIGFVSMGLFSSGLITMGLISWGKVNMSLMNIPSGRMHQSVPAPNGNSHQHMNH